MKISTKRIISGAIATAVLAGGLISAKPVFANTTSTDAVTHFAVIGDYGNGSANETAVANLVKSWSPDFIITTGDNNYDSGSASTIDVHIGKDYHEFIGNYTGAFGAGSPVNRFWPSLGNHDWGTANVVPYKNYFTLPGNERYYDFVQGDVHFFAVDSDSHEPDGWTASSVQALWLKNALATSTSIWNVVYFHVPPYASGSNHPSVVVMRWPFKAWGADVVLTGHNHNYERLIVDGFPFFVNGAGGRSLYAFASPIPESVFRYNADYGAMLVDANSTTMTFQFINKGGTVIDNYSIYTVPTTLTNTPNVTNTPTYTATVGIPTPTRTPTNIVPPTPTHTPTNTLVPTLGSTPTPTVITSTDDYMIISRNDLMSLPTSGAGWEAIKASADASATPNICNQDNKADVNALAAGLVYARTGNAAYRTKVVNLLNAAIASQHDGCGNAVLALGRQLGGYVMAADFANYHDPVFTAWLTNILDREIGGHSRWHVLRWTAYDSSNNWGTFALTSTTVADIYLQQTTDIEKDWQVFSNYGVPHGWPFTRPAAYQENWSCVTDGQSDLLPIAINIPCVKAGVNLDGAPVADSSRSIFPQYSGYIQEATQGFVVMAQLFTRTGRNGWTVNDSQICRAAGFADRSGRLQQTSVASYIPFMANHFCGLNIQTKTPTNGGRLFGFTDWLFTGATPPITVTVIVPPTATFTNVPPTKTVTPSATNTLVFTNTATRTPSPQIPTVTRTPTPTMTLSIPTPTPTLTPSGVPPTNTLTVTNTPKPTATPVCPVGWKYKVLKDGGIIFEICYRLKP